MKFSVWPTLIGRARAEIAVAQPVTVCAPASSSTVWSAPLVKLGASLTAVTVIDERLRAPTCRRRRWQQYVAAARTCSTVVFFMLMLISHNLHDIFAVADRITVLRLGRNVTVYQRSQTTQQEVVQAITAGAPTKVSGIEDAGA